MKKAIKISLDCMGGDHGPSVVIPAAAHSLERNPTVSFLLFGKEPEILAVLNQFPQLKERSTVIHTDVMVRMDDKPSQALRAGRKSSMWLCLDAVKKGEADVAVSAGNTGALMAMSRFCLRMLPGVDRPAIAAIWPTLRGESIVLDVGASIGAEAGNLVDMALMGAAMARILFGMPQPTVGLLNVGVEEIKGIEEVKAAGQILKQRDFQGLAYKGFVEGDDLGKGTVDVVVTEGFAGNIALKTAEGTAKQIGEYLRSAMSQSFSSKIGYLFARGAFQSLKKKMDPRRANGGVFLGLDGVVIKSHGGADALGFASAIDMAGEMVQQGLLTKIREALMATEELEEAQLIAEYETAGEQA